MLKNSVFPNWCDYLSHTLTIHQLSLCMKQFVNVNEPCCWLKKSARNAAAFRPDVLAIQQCYDALSYSFPSYRLVTCAISVRPQYMDSKK